METFPFLCWTSVAGRNSSATFRGRKKKIYFAALNEPVWNAVQLFWRFASPAWGSRYWYFGIRVSWLSAARAVSQIQKPTQHLWLSATYWKRHKCFYGWVIWVWSVIESHSLFLLLCGGNSFSQYRVQHSFVRFTRSRMLSGKLWCLSSSVL